MLDGVAQLNQMAAKTFGDPEINTRIAQYEMAFRMQTSVPELTDLSGEARKTLEAGIPHEMVLLDLYAALRPLDAITGATTVEDILDNIFSTFCIGK